MTFHKQLKAAQETLGLTHVAMALNLGIAPRTYYLWLDPRKAPMPITQEGASARLDALIRAQSEQAAKAKENAL